MRINLSMDNAKGAFVIDGLYLGAAATTADPIHKVTLSAPCFFMNMVRVHSTLDAQLIKS